MAELIDKGALKEMFPCNGEGSWTYNVTAKAYIDSLPTTTEAEIRASAFSEMHDKLIAYFAEWQSMEIETEIQYLLTLVCEGIDEIAEELKEGADNGK